MHAVSLERPWRADAQAAGTVGFAHLTSHFFQFLLPPIYPWLMHDFGIGYTEAGFLATVFFIVSSTGQAMAGFAVDRFGAFRLLQIAVALLAAAGLLLGLSQSYAGLVATAAVAGAGNAIFHPADFTILNRRVSPSRLGHAFAVHGVTGNLGWVAGASFMVTVTRLADWHVAGFGAALVALGALAVLSLQRPILDGQHALRAAVAPAPATSSAAAPVSDPGHFAFLRSVTVWLCFGFFFLSTGAGGVLQNFAPAMLSNVYPVTIVFATWCLTSYLLGSACGTVLGGFVAGRERRSARVVAAALVVSALISLLLATASLPGAALPVALFLLGAGSGVAGPNRDLLVRQAATSRFGPASFGRVYGFVYSGLDLGLALAPLAVGRILDQGLFRSGLLCVAVLQISAVFVALRVGRKV
jgi:MFS family permease